LLRLSANRAKQFRRTLAAFRRVEFASQSAHTPRIKRARRNGRSPRSSWRGDTLWQGGNRTLICDRENPNPHPESNRSRESQNDQRAVPTPTTLRNTNAAFRVLSHSGALMRLSVVPVFPGCPALSSHLRLTSDHPHIYPCAATDDWQFGAGGEACFLFISMGENSIESSFLETIYTVFRL
jgi:hypothetical protein